MDDNTEQEIPQEGPEDVSPSFKGGKRKPSAPKKAAEKAEDKLKKPVDKAVKKGARQLAINAARVVASWIASAISAAAAAVGWPVLVGCLVIFLIVMLIFGGLLCLSINGNFGKTLPIPAGKNDPNVQELIAATKQKAGGDFLGTSADIHKLDFLNKRDFEYLESGQIDKRLAAALNYLVKKHQHIRVSHLVSGYEDMKIDPESGAFHDTQITKNISAHKRDTAADLDEIDLVKEKCKCGKDISVSVAWQAIGENPFGTAPDALNNVKSASDLAQEEVKEALKELGVGGLDQADIEAKLQTITGISSVYDLTNPQVIEALNAIGITGIDNPDLQAGIKRLQAIQSIYELNPQDLDALTSGQNADLLSQIGINITPEVRETIEDYQKAQVLATISSPEDLARPDVQEALRALEIDPDDPALKTSLEKIFAAKTVLNWQGNMDDAKFQDALSKLNLSGSAELQTALALYQGYKNGLETQPGYVLNAITALAALDKSGVSYDSPESQNTLSVMRALAEIQKPSDSLLDTAKVAALAYVQFNLTPQNRVLFEKYQAADYILNFHGSLDDPELRAAMAKLEISENVLQDFQTATDVMAALKKHTNLRDLFPDDFLRLDSLQTVLNIRKLGDLQNPAVQEALAEFDINISGQYETIAQYANVISLVKSITLNDLAKALGEGVMVNLNLSPEIEKQLGNLGNIAALARVRNPMDLTRPEVVRAFNDLKINTGDLGTMLGKAGDINALTSIKNPEDLLRPSTLKALGDLKVINVDSEFLGQIGAAQTLLQVRSLEDLFNPTTILSLNTLGIISLSNPIIGALTAVSLFSQFLGINLFGLGGCEGSTGCYKPTAQKNVHTAIGELLQMPYDLGRPDFYRATQIITYSEERDVLPFADQLDTLYGRGRQNNYGLFAMPEAHDHLHIGY